MAIGKTYGVKRTVWIEVRSENKSWYYDNSLLIYFHFPLPLRASCMAGVVSNAFKTDMYQLCQTTSTRKRFLTQAWNWLKSVISDRVKRYEAGAEIYYNSVYYFRHAHYEQVSPAWCNNLCTQSPGDPNEAITWKANIVKRLCLKL